MSEPNRTYHRLGEPGGPGCQVVALSVTIRSSDGTKIPARLLDGGPQASELELLRTVAHGLGVNWGHDDLGWWAVVASAKIQ